MTFSLRALLRFFFLVAVVLATATGILRYVHRPFLPQAEFRDVVMDVEELESGDMKLTISAEMTNLGDMIFVAWKDGGPEYFHVGEEMDFLKVVDGLDSLRALRHLQSVEFTEPFVVQGERWNDESLPLYFGVLVQEDYPKPRIRYIVHPIAATQRLVQPSPIP